MRRISWSGSTLNQTEIAFPVSGCAQSGAISRSGNRTKARSDIRGCGTIKRSPAFITVAPLDKMSKIDGSRDVADRPNPPEFLLDRQ